MRISCIIINVFALFYNLNKLLQFAKIILSNFFVWNLNGYEIY